jgi:hypothetical protein
MFADDTNISVNAKNIIDLEPLLNDELAHIHDWLLCNKLSLNVAKTEFMIIGSRQRFTAHNDQPIKVMINDNEIRKVEFATSLGVTIDKNLNWSVHVENLIKKVSSAVGALKRVRPFITTTTAIQIYKTLILPHFDYCCTVWGSLSQQLSDQLQKLQNRAARVITKSSYESRSIELLNDLGWDKLMNRRCKRKATLMFKTMNKLVPKYIQNLFTQKSNPKYHLRNQEYMLSLPKPRTEYLKNSFSYSGAKLWNGLSSTAKEAKTLAQFRKVIQNEIT